MNENDFIEIYKNNMFLLKRGTEELWFSLNNPLEKAFYKRAFAILTAWNPNNIATADEINATANKMLQSDLAEYKILDSVGKYKEHQENSFLIYDISLKDALLLGVKYHQYSLFYNDTYSLSYIECSTQKILVNRAL